VVLLARAAAGLEFVHHVGVFGVIGFLGRNGLTEEVEVLAVGQHLEEGVGGEASGGGEEGVDFVGLKVFGVGFGGCGFLDSGHRSGPSQGVADLNNFVGEVEAAGVLGPVFHIQGTFVFVAGAEVEDGLVEALVVVHGEGDEGAFVAN